VWEPGKAEVRANGWAALQRSEWGAAAQFQGFGAMSPSLPHSYIRRFALPGQLWRTVSYQRASASTPSSDQVARRRKGRILLVSAGIFARSRTVRHNVLAAGLARISFVPSPTGYVAPLQPDRPSRPTTRRMTTTTAAAKYASKQSSPKLAGPSHVCLDSPRLKSRPPRRLR